VDPLSGLEEPINVKSLVRIGRDSRIDSQAIIGYLPTRKLNDSTLTIGEGAIIRSGSVIYLGSRIGQKFETGHNVIVREENDILDDVKIWSNTIVDFQCKIGSNVKIHSNCYISQMSLVEDDVFIAPGVLLANEKYPTGKFSEERIRGPVIRRGARIGMGTIIMPGVVIGEHSLIGAGALVTKDVPPGAVYYGIPARIHSPH